MSESPTPRTDAESIDISERCWGTCHDAIELARQLERELDAVEREIGRHQPELCDEIRMERDDLKKQLAAAQGELERKRSEWCATAHKNERLKAQIATNESLTISAWESRALQAEAVTASVMKEWDVWKTHAWNYSAKIDSLRMQLNRLSTMGVCQLAAELNNPPLREYMKHWEYRAETAEAALAERERQVEALVSVLKTQQCPDTLTGNRCKLVDNKTTCEKCWREWSLNEARKVAEK